jgi:hypothetical protein
MTEIGYMIVKIGPKDSFGVSAEFPMTHLGVFMDKAQAHDTADTLENIPANREHTFQIVPLMIHH